MRRLRIFEHISLDGVVQHSTDADFPYADWTVPYRTPAGRDAVQDAQGERFDLILGRTTYDLWSGHWPQITGMPMADRINSARKYVVTHRPEGLSWGPCEPLGEDLVGEVRRLKEQDGPDLLVWGSSTLTSTLLEYGLAEELVLIVYPVLLGAGKRLFAEGTPAQTFELVDSQAFPSGALLQTYRSQGSWKHA